VVRWAIVPVCKSDDESSRVQLIEEMRREAGVVNFGIKA